MTTLNPTRRFATPLLIAALLALGSASALAQSPTTVTPAQPDPALGGQASTTVIKGNQANPTQVPDGTAPASRAAVRESAKHKKPPYGQKGERPDVPTNPTEKTGTPK